MKKIYLYILGFVFVLLGSGCLGSTEEDIIGTYRLAPGTQTFSWIHDVEMTINADGTITFTDLTTLYTDDGTWELTPSLANHRFTVSGVTTPPTMQLNWNAEWRIIHLSETSLIWAAKGGEYGGVTQFDWVRQ